MAKTFSFAAVHCSVAFLVGYVMTGSVWVGGALALVEPACNTLAFHLHEKAWLRIEGRRPAAPPPMAAWTGAGRPGAEPSRRRLVCSCEGLRPLPRRSLPRRPPEPRSPPGLRLSGARCASSESGARSPGWRRTQHLPPTQAPSPRRPRRGCAWYRTTAPWRRRRRPAAWSRCSRG